MSNTGTTEVPPPISNDQLAANLQKCAIFVKKGEKDPLIRETIHDLTFYLTGKRVRSSQSQQLQPQPQQRTPNQTSPQTVSKHMHVSLGGVLGKMVGLTHDDASSSAKSESSKAATSAKNAARLKAEVDSHDWCEIHFTRGCACKARKSSKPGFQRPSNPSSSLIANGWVEQQRRSKMRPVWKEVLASLVEGRKPGEETTLWIQREFYNSTKDKTELEALHQIPIKWLEEVSYSQYSTDHRFILKVYNLSEEFIFRCSDQEAAQNWVLTLRSMQEIARKAQGKKTVKTGIDDWEEFAPKNSIEDEKKVPEQQAQYAQAVPYPGVRTQYVSQNGVHASQGHGAVAPTPQQAHSRDAAATAVPEHKPYAEPKQPPPTERKPPPPPPSATRADPPASAAPMKRMTVSELRAIAHGAGVVTHGMERDELEHIVLQISASGSSTSPVPPAARTPSSRPTSPNSAKSVGASASMDEPSKSYESNVSRDQLKEEAAQRRKLAEAAAKRQAADEMARKQQAERQKQEEEERKRREEEEHRRRLQAAEQQKRMKEEEERKRLEAERKRREEEEHRRRVLEMQAAEQRRRQEEQKRQQQEQWQKHQQQWQAEQAAEARRQQAEQQRAAEERRRQEEAYRAQQQQWYQQQQQRPTGAPPQPQWQQHHQVPPNQRHQQFGSQQQQQQPPFAHGNAPPHPPPPPSSGSSPVNMKYAKMAAQTGDGSHMTLQTIKHGILVEWALQPPAMQVLRPIEQLLSSIHTVFPPKFGVPAHDHFAKWKIVSLPELMAGAQADDEKLKKAFRKLRFFLHPDRLPRDFSDEHQYMCKMLWDISSDAYDDHKKREEELGWMR